MKQLPWKLAAVIGLLLTLLSFAYVGYPGGRAYDPGRPQLSAPRPEIQITKTKVSDINEWSHPDQCAAVITDEHRGFPVSMLNRFGADSCTQNRYLHPLGIVFNFLFYTLLAAGVIGLWQEFKPKPKRTHEP